MSTTTPTHAAPARPASVAARARVRGLPARARALAARALAACALLALTGCSIFAPTISVTEVPPAEVYRQLDACVLEDGELSAGTRDVLHAFNLSAVAEDDPRGALVALHAAAVDQPYPAVIFALSELSFLVGESACDRDAFLASAVYAWHYLFGDADAPPSPYDRRFRWACDLYNNGLMLGTSSPSHDRVLLQPGQRRLPVGSIELEVDRATFHYTPEEYPELLPADRFQIRGLTLRLRDAGLGVALIAVPDPALMQTAAARQDSSRIYAKMPATLFLRVDGSLADMHDGLRGTLELHATYDSGTVDVAGREVPLESDISVVLAHAMHRSPVWKFSLHGLLHGDTAVKDNRLYFTRTPERGRVPIVFVHGTASNPAYWVPMFNVLLNDPVLRRRTQCWFFQYTSGNPLLYSAMTLRDQLAATLERIDPEGTDPDLRRMVVIGHSQGGLITKLLVVDGSLAWFEETTHRPLDDFGLDEAQAALLRRAYEFDPLPFVERVVFIATPHRGSFLADRYLARMLAKLITLPGEVQGTLTTLLRDQERLPPQLRGRIPTSLDNMRASNPLLGILLRAPIAADTTAHSIVAIGDADPDDPAEVAEADDGVVAYTSAYLEPVDSEQVVQSGHSCQAHPVTIAEVLRILRLHLAEDAESATAGTQPGAPATD